MGKQERERVKDHYCSYITALLQHCTLLKMADAFLVGPRAELREMPANAARATLSLVIDQLVSWLEDAFSATPSPSPSTATPPAGPAIARPRPRPPPPPSPTLSPAGPSQVSLPPSTPSPTTASRVQGSGAKPQTYWSRSMLQKRADTLFDAGLTAHPEWMEHLHQHLSTRVNPLADRAVDMLHTCRLPPPDTLQEVMQQVTSLHTVANVVRVLAWFEVGRVLKATTFSTRQVEAFAADLKGQLYHQMVRECGCPTCQGMRCRPHQPALWWSAVQFLGWCSLK